MLLSDKNAELPQIKLLDFGTARAFHLGESELDDVAGSVLYLAPEIALKGENKPQSDDKYPDNYNELCDMWSVGVITYLLLIGELPFNLQDVPEARTMFRTFLENPYDRTCIDPTDEDSWFNSMLGESEKQFIRSLLCMRMGLNKE